MPEEKKTKNKHQKKEEKQKTDYKELSKELENKYKRALADYQNLVKQSAQDKQNFVKYANGGLISEFLPVYDNLKTAFEHADDEAENNGWLEGIKYVIKQFKNVLENNGVKEIKTVGEKFNPEKMEAVENKETKDKKQDDIVAKELKPGYELNNKVINPARVAVYKYKN